MLRLAALVTVVLDHSISCVRVPKGSELVIV